MPVDTLDPTWINAPGGVGPSYDSEELRRNQAFTIARGATPGSARAGILAVGDLALSLSGMNVRLGAGGCVVATAKGAYVTGFAATTTVDALQAADVTNPRRDRVVIEILDPDNGGGAGRKGQARVITGTPNASAATGGGYPAEPSGPVLTIGYVDVPKSGAGSPVLTMTAPYTAAAGAPIPVMSRAEMEAITGASRGMKCTRLDLPGAPVATHNGTRWELPPLGVISTLKGAGTATVTGNTANNPVETFVPLEANRKIKIQAQIRGKSSIAGAVIAYWVRYGGTGTSGAIAGDVHNHAFTQITTEESEYFEGDFVNTTAGNVRISFVAVVTSVKPTALVTYPINGIFLTVEDCGPA